MSAFLCPKEHYEAILCNLSEEDGFDHMVNMCGVVLCRTFKPDFLLKYPVGIGKDGWTAHLSKTSRYRNDIVLARLLANQNFRSLKARYDDEFSDDDIIRIGDVFGFRDMDDARRRHKLYRDKYSLMDSMKLLSSWEYQSCETDDFLHTAAFKAALLMQDTFIQRLFSTHAELSKLRENATWAVDMSRTGENGDD